MRLSPGGGSGAPARAVAALLALGTLCGLVARAPAQTYADAGPDPGPALGLAAELRRRVDPGAGPVESTWLPLRYRGRSSIEVKGRTPEGQLRDLAIVDVASGSLSVFVYFPNASRRAAGEPILPMSEISVRADVHLRGLHAGEDLMLSGIQRYRASGEESVYYEVRYAPPASAFPFLDPPVRLLLEAVTGALFRVDEEPGWRLAPEPEPGRLLSARAAERIALVVLRSRRAASALGAAEGAAVRILGTEPFYVRPNGWLGSRTEDDAGLRLAQVVAFRVEGAAPPGPHSLYVDAQTGRVLGGEPAAAP